MTELQPRVAGKYQLFETLHEDDLGIAHRGFDPFRGREVTVRRLIDAMDGVGRDEATLLTLFEGVRQASRLHHPNIAEIFDAGISGSDAYLVREYVRGNTLKDMLQGRNKGLAVRLALNICMSAARALDHAHRLGVTHGDLKPASIMLDAAGGTKILDLGLAVFSRQSNIKQQLRPHAYSAPEVLADQHVGTSADLYGLAACGYHMLTGVPPFKGGKLSDLTRDVMQTIPRRLPDVNPELPAELSTVFERALSKQPTGRYPDGHAFAEALAACLGGSDVQPSRASKTARGAIVRRQELFKQFSEADVQALLACSPLLTFRAGQAVVREGEVDDALYVLIEGLATVQKGAREVAVVRGGDYFGEIAFVAESRRSASVIAITPLQVLRISRSNIGALSVDARLTLFEQLSDVLVERLIVTTERYHALL